MSTDPLDRSDDDVAKEMLKPIDDLLVKEDEELKKVDERIREAERKHKSMYQPEP